MPGKNDQNGTPLPNPRNCEGLKRKTRCDKGYRCLEPDAEALCEARDLGMERFIECLAPDGDKCRHALPFGKGRFCRCPIRICLEKQLHPSSAPL